MTNEKQQRYEQMGGRAAVIEISKDFYDKVYKHPWLKHYFAAIPQDHIEAQQIEFMQSALGGENRYVGKSPSCAHMHMYITEELFEARHKVLLDSFKACHASNDIIERWIKIEFAFKKTLVVTSLDQCKPRYPSDPILNFPNPHG